MQLILATLHCFYWPRFLTSLINRNWEARQKIQARLYWGPCCSREEQKQATVSLSCSLAPQRGQAGSLYGVTASCPGLGSEGWLRCFAHPFDCGVCRGYAQYSPLALGSSEVAVGIFWSFCILLSMVCPNWACAWLLPVPYSFFIFCRLRRHRSMCKHCSKGHRVPALSLSQFTSQG